MFKRILFFLFAFSSIFCHSAMAEVSWQREYGAVVNGEELAGAYLGGTSILRPAFVDIDNDGDDDMFVGEYSGKILFYRNDGTSNSPSWKLITEDYNSIDVGGESAPIFCDIDGDGDYDMFIGEWDGNQTVS